MKQLTVRKEVMISEKQAETLKKLKGYGIKRKQLHSHCHTGKD